MSARSSLCLCLVTLLVVAGAAACRDPRILDVEKPRVLEPYPNPFGPEDPRFEEPPHRGKPQKIVVHPDGRRAYVAMPGNPDDPNRTIAVVDIEQGTLLKTIEVGDAASGLAMHPGGRFLVALAKYANHASVIDTNTDEVLHRPPMDHYAIEAVFGPEGRLYVTNRWRDAVLVYDTLALHDGLVLTQVASIPVAQNPRDIAISSDGRTVAVGSMTALSVSLIDTERLTETARVNLMAPANGVAFAGDWVVVPTLSASTHHLPTAGPDGDHDGQPGDGTPNVNFQDLQNEVAVLRATDGAVVARYTSDSICCKDFRDVQPEDTARHGDLLPPRSDWIVAGALPEQVAVGTVDGETRAFVSYSSSDEIQSFAVDSTTGHLTSRQVFPSAGHSPHGLVVAGDKLLVAHRLSETLGIYDAASGGAEHVVLVGDVSDGNFPATDVEIGEMVNDQTSFFSIDGDQACVQCHRENNNMAKALSMPLFRYPAMGFRMIMGYRGAADSRPWFNEGAMDETNFRPVLNEFSRIENFCCQDYTLFPEGPPAGCAENPPPECSSAPNTSSASGFDPVRRDEFTAPRPTPYLNRDQFYSAASARLMGRTETFGTGLYYEDPITSIREPIPLDFDGVTRALGLFLLGAPRFLPNPNDPDSTAARRGKALFESAAVGCAVCHPAPTFAVSTDNNPFEVPLRFPPVVTPTRSPEGKNYDLLTNGFIQIFPVVEMDTCEAVCGEELCAADASACDEERNLRMGVTGLRGIWDRAEMFLHDGRAKNLREVLCTPGHPALKEGERGFNERDGIPDTHGGTSQLTPQEIEDLIAFMLTL